MKKIFFVLGFVLLVSTLSAQSFRLDGSLTNFGEEVDYVYINYQNGKSRVMDSTRVKDGKYSFKGNITEPVLANFRVKFKNNPESFRLRRNYAAIYLQPGQIGVSHNDSFVNVSVNGSAAHLEYQSLQEKTKPVSLQMNELMTKYSELSRAKDEEGLKKLDARYEELNEEMKQVYKSYLSENSHSPIAMYALNEVAGWSIDPELVEPLFNSLPEKTRKLPSAVELKEKIDLAKLTAVGKPALNFTQNDTLGKPVSLSSFKGKYVLIDFWASWCGPCRKENPNLVDAFNKYKDKGFHVIGVSLDQPTGKDKWIKAIHDDGLWWTQLSDLKYWKNEVAVQYGIQAIPQNFLLDRNGIIIAKNLTGEKLQQKLAEIFK